MSNIVEVIVDPILGDDSTGAPVANGSVDFFYKTLDGAINDNPVYDLLIVRVNKGDVEMNQLSYRNIEINKVVIDSKLIINGHVGVSILFTNITLNINTEIRLPEDNVPNPNVDPDVPVIIVEENALFLTNGNNFNVIDTISAPNLINRGRIIIFSDFALILIDNDDGTIDVSSRDVILIQGGVITYVNGFSEMLTTDNFLLNTLLPEGLYSKSGNPDLIGDWTIFPLNRDAVNIKKNSTFAGNIVWVFAALGPIGVGIALILKYAVATSKIQLDIFPRVEVNTGSTNLLISPTSTNLLVEQAGFAAYRLVTIVPPPTQLLKNTNKNLKLEEYRGKPSILLKKLKADADLEEASVSISGTFLRNANPTFLRAFITDSPANITTVSLEDVEVFPLENVTTLAPNQLSANEGIEYNNKFDSNSYNNNGSIFREVKLIQSNYTHTRFDGNVFAVNASAGDIVITVPIDALENRLFTYKRIDSTNNSVIITTPNGIDLKKNYKLKNKCCDKGNKKSVGCRTLGKVKFVGYNDKLWII